MSLSLISLSLPTQPWATQANQRLSLMIPTCCGSRSNQTHNSLALNEECGQRETFLLGDALPDPHAPGDERVPPVRFWHRGSSPLSSPYSPPARGRFSHATYLIPIA